MKPIEIAERIADKLFIDGGTKEVAKRLVLEKQQKYPGAGWCREAVRDVIEKELTRSSNQTDTLQGLEIAAQTMCVLCREMLPPTHMGTIAPRWWHVTSNGTGGKSRAICNAGRIRDEIARRKGTA